MTTPSGEVPKTKSGWYTVTEVLVEDGVTKNARKYPGLIIDRLLSVQPMTGQPGRIFYEKYVDPEEFVQLEFDFDSM